MDASGLQCKMEWQGLCQRTLALGMHLSESSRTRAGEHSMLALLRLCWALVRSMSFHVGYSVNTFHMCVRLSKTRHKVNTVSI